MTVWSELPARGHQLVAITKSEGVCVLATPLFPLGKMMGELVGWVEQVLCVKCDAMGVWRHAP